MRPPRPFCLPQAMVGWVPARLRAATDLPPTAPCVGASFLEPLFRGSSFFLFHFYFLFFAFASACVTVPLQISGLKHCSFFLCLPRSSGLDVPGNRHCSVCLSQTLAEKTVARNIIPFPAQSLIRSRPTQRPNFAAALLPHVCQLLQVFVCNVAVESELWLGWALKGL